MLHPTEPRCTLMSYAAPYSATIHSTELLWTLLWAVLHPSGLLCTLWITLHPTELGLTLLNCSKLKSTLTELPPFIQFFRMPESELRIQDVYPGSKFFPSRIRILTFYPSRIQGSKRHWIKKKCRCQKHSVTRIRRLSPVPEGSGTGTDWDDECQNADAGGIGLNTDAQLCPLPI